MAEKPYDLAILGAGQAGCTLAGNIAEKGVHPTTGEPLKIALLDRGAYLKGKPNPGYGHPIRRQMFTNVSLDFAGRYSQMTGLPPGKKRKVPVQQGQEVYLQRTPSIFGGGTHHYTALTHVPHEVDYRVWVEETGADWSYQNLKPFADQINRDFNIHTRPEALLTRLDHLVGDTAPTMGYPTQDVTIAKRNCLLSGYCDGINHCKYDARMGSFVAYLPIAEERGVEMIPDATVQRVLFEKRGNQARVVGLEYTQGGVRQRLEAERVIVSCGDYGNPALLYRSGYGPRELTDGDPIVENRNVGRNTDNRPQFSGPVGIFDEPLSDGQFHHEAAYYIYHDLHPDKRYERVEISIKANTLPRPQQAALDPAAPEFGQAHKTYMGDVGNASVMTQARSRFLSRSLSSMHVVRPREVRGWINEWGEQIYQAHDPSILKAFEQGRELIYELLKKMGAREIVGMDQPIRIRHLSTFVGSCIVGTDRKNSVVNPHFESHDIDGLFICDGSVVPRAASQGYAGTVATVALFAASRIVDRHFKRG